MRQHLVRREQDKRLAVRLLQVKGDRANGLVLERIRLAGRVGKVPRQVDGHLAGIVKRAAQRQRLGLVQPQPRLDEIELGRRADAERGRGQDAGRDRSEEQLFAVPARHPAGPTPAAPAAATFLRPRPSRPPSNPLAAASREISPASARQRFSAASSSIRSVFSLISTCRVADRRGHLVQLFGKSSPGNRSAFAPGR